MDENGESLEGNEFVFPQNLKPPSIGSKFKKLNQDILIEQPGSYSTIETEIFDRPVPQNMSNKQTQSQPQSPTNSTHPSPVHSPSPSRSPVDPTPIVIHGSEYAREDFTPIVEDDDPFFVSKKVENQQVQTRFNTNDLSGKQLDVYSRRQGTFDPPFPKSSYAESTDASISPNHYQPQPKITSPSSPDISYDPRPLQQPFQSKVFQIDTIPGSKKISAPSSPEHSPERSPELNYMEDKSNYRPLQPQLQQPQVQTKTTATQLPKSQPTVQTQLPKQTSAQPSASAPAQPKKTNTDKDKTQSQSQGQGQSQPQEPPPTKEELISRAHDYYLKYQILQKSWPEYKFPNIDENLVHSNPQIVIDSYTTSIERIQIDMDVSQYKIALIIMFLVIEVVCVKFLGFDAGGYTLSQIKAMNRYEKLLIEIGERKLLAGGDSWPPEVKILFIGLFNCGLFILMKYLSSILGPQLVSYLSPIVNGLFSGVLDTSKAASLPDEVPQRQQDISGMLGNVASMAANAFTNNNTAAQQNTNARSQPKAPRRPVYRE